MMDHTTSASQEAIKQLAGLERRPRAKKNSVYTVRVSNEDPSNEETVVIFDTAKIMPPNSGSQESSGSFLVEVDDVYADPKQTELALQQLKELDNMERKRSGKGIVKKKKLIWDPSTKNVIATHSEEPTPSPSKKKRSEVDRLLADEGVIEIMRDQQVAIDDSGYLLNITKGSKTRNQRMKQEEPERTPNDWNICSMIARRRSSSFSELESVHMDPPTPVNSKEEHIPVDADEEEMERRRPGRRLLNGDVNGNVISPKRKTVAKAKSPTKGLSPKEAAIPASLPELPKASPKRRTVASSKATEMARKAAPIEYRGLKVEEKTNFFQVTILPVASVDPDLFSSEVCEELIAFLNEQKANPDCKMVLLGPLKFDTNGDFPYTPSIEGIDLIKTLAKFPKSIFAAVQGTVEGLGLSLLPLFDMVFAKYGTEFTFSKDLLVGGVSIFLNSAKINQNIASQFLFTGETATSTRALECGLVSQEIPSKNDSDFTKKVIAATEEVVDNFYTDRIELYKKLWTDRNLDNLLSDLEKESIRYFVRKGRLYGDFTA